MVVEIRDWCQNVGECPNPPGGAAGEVCHPDCLVTNEMAAEIRTELWPDGYDERTRMSAMEASAIDEDIIEPVPRQLSAEVVEESEPVDITCEEYTDEHLIKNETTNLSVITYALDLSN